MNPLVTIQKLDESYIRIKCEDTDIHLKIFRYFSYKIPGIQFSPLYKMGQIDGLHKFYNFGNRTFPLGLIQQLKSFLTENNIPYELEDFEEYPEITEKEIDDFLQELKLPFEPRDYQKEMIIKSLNNRRMVNVAGTGSGKSLAIYIVSMYIKLKLNQKVLIVVPSTMLVNQMYKDFIDYGIEQFDVSVHTIYSGKAKIFEDDFIISTWQSIYKAQDIQKLKEANIGCVIGDEAHRNKDSKKVSTIFFGLRDTKYKLGFTGTVPKDELERQQMIAIAGEPHKIIKTKELVKQGIGTDLDITAIYLKYPPHICKENRRMRNYQKEMTLINLQDSKINFCTKFGVHKAKESNTVVFFNTIIFGQELYEKMKALHKKTYYIDGSTKAEYREEIRQKFETEDNILLVVSSKIFSTGINIKNLHNLIFAENIGKSFVSLIQSLGRMVRKHSTKNKAFVYDIVDDLSDKKSFRNFAFRHFLERMDYYREEGWFVKEKTYELN